jgi:hypothetical protein
MFFHYICFFILFLIVFVLNNYMNIVMGFVFIQYQFLVDLFIGFLIFSNRNFIFLIWIFLIEFMFSCYLFIVNIFELILFFFWLSVEVSNIIVNILYITVIILDTSTLNQKKRHLYEIMSVNINKKEIIFLFKIKIYKNYF